MSEEFQHKKSLGQHFLNSDVVPKWMCDAADLKAGDTVLEVGPGTGILTREILNRGAQVISLEADTRAILELNNNFAEQIAKERLIVHHTDVRTMDLGTLPNISNNNFKVVANIPYYLSGMLFRMFLESDIQPTDLVFLVQKEVAKRATSCLKKGDKESLLSLSVQAYGDSEYVRSVGRGHFVPPPKVDSGIVAIHNISKDNFSSVDEKLFFTLLHLGFGQKRKQLLGNLASEYNRDKLSTIFKELEISETIRAEDLDLKNWLSLTKALEELNPPKPYI